MNFQFQNYHDQTFPIRRAYIKGTQELIFSHYHQAMELLLVEKGCLSVFVNGNTLDCVQGDLILVPSFGLHHAVSKEKNTAVKAVIFEPSLVAHKDPDIFPDEIFSKEFSVTYVLNEDEKAIDTFLALYELCEITAFSAADVLEILSALYLILGRYTRHFHQNESVVPTFSRIAPVIEYIKANYQRPIRLNELSELLHVCDDHLIRLFKKSTSKTPNRYISDLRVEQAMRLLIDTELPIAEISEEVGFSTPNFMTKVFGQRVGMSPGEYRKKHSKSRQFY